jgi:hypothetical protein
VTGADYVEKIDCHFPELIQHDRQFLKQLAGAQVLDVVYDSFDAQDPFAFIVDFERKISKVELEHGKVESRSFDNPLKTGWSAPDARGVSGAIFPTENGLELVHIQHAAGTVNETLKDLVKHSAAGEQKISTEHDSVHTVIVAFEQLGMW